MPNKDIKTEPRFMTMIQKDLLPTCKALNLDVDPFANARTVFIDRDSVGRILSYMSDHEINPEWYGLLPDNLFVGTGLPVLTGVEGEYFARMTGRNLTKKVAAKTFIADMEAYWLSKDNLKRTDGTKGNGTTLGFGRCPDYAKPADTTNASSKSNEYEYTNPVDEYGIDTVSRYRQVGEIYNEVGQCFKGMAQASTPLAPFVFLTHKEYEGGLDTVVNHCPYITHSDATRIIDGMRQFPPKRSVDRFMLAFTMTAFAFAMNQVEESEQYETVEVKPPKTEIRRHSGAPKTTLLIHLKPESQHPRPRHPTPVKPTNTIGTASPDGSKPSPRTLPRKCSA